MKISLFPLILMAIFGGIAYAVAGPRAALVVMGAFFTLVTVITLMHLKGE